MSRTQKGSKDGSFDYGAKRPANKGWHLSPFMGGKRIANKVDRQAAKAELPERLEDDYTYHDRMADICTDEQPCELCQRRAVKRQEG